jgi:hypothetical protein
VSPLMMTIADPPGGIAPGAVGSRRASSTTSNRYRLPKK